MSHHLKAEKSSKIQSELREKYLFKRQNVSTNAFVEMAVFGYVRNEFTEKCMVGEIIKLIICFYKSSNGILYIFGNGENGKLGLREYHNKLCKQLTICLPFDGYENYAMDVATSINNTLILDIYGKVWICGGWFLGNGRQEIIKVPEPLKLECKVKSVSSGRSHSLILLQNGNVQSFGSNRCGLGHERVVMTLVPKTIETLKKYKIVQICAGYYHSAALTEDGDLFCFGMNEDGQCGVGKEKGNQIMIPTKVELDDKIAFVDCGKYHSLLITFGGLLHTFGDSHSGQLGHGSTPFYMLRQRPLWHDSWKYRDTKYTPTLVEALKYRIFKACAGSNHSLCVDKRGVVWSFGNNGRGQCGLPRDIYIQTTPKMIEWFIENNIQAVGCAAGGNQSCVIAEDGSLYLFGELISRRKGIKSYFTPEKLSLPQNVIAKKISMGHQYIGIIC